MLKPMPTMDMVVVMVDMEAMVDMDEDTDTDVNADLLMLTMDMVVMVDTVVDMEVMVDTVMAVNLASSQFFKRILLHNFFPTYQRIYSKSQIPTFTLHTLVIYTDIFLIKN